MRVKVWKPLLVLLASFAVLSGIVSFIFYQGYQQRIDDEQKVMTVCSVAHVQDDGKSEEECEQMQDKYKVKFVCNKENAGCWVEL